MNKVYLVWTGYKSMDYYTFVHSVFANKKDAEEFSDGQNELLYLFKTSYEVLSLYRARMRSQLGSDAIDLQMEALEEEFDGFDLDFMDFTVQETDLIV